jgi:hypothetical protein
MVLNAELWSINSILTYVFFLSRWEWAVLSVIEITLSVDLLEWYANGSVDLLEWVQGVLDD